MQYLRELKLKPDFGDTIRRFEAWWRGETLDRPPVTLHVKPARPYRGPDKRHATVRERWMDVEFNVDRAIADLERHDYPGESFPSYFANLGPEILSTLFGCELAFSEDTSWAVPIYHDTERWKEFLGAKPNYDNPYWRTIERMTDYALQCCDGRFIVGNIDLHGNMDLLASLRDPEALCIDLLDVPELIAPAALHAAKANNECFNRIWKKAQAAGMGSVCWTPFYHEGPAYVPQSDFWCMVGGDMARRIVLPSILVEMEPIDCGIFHLDGPTALRHLDILLEIPKLNAVQWVFGAGNGPAARWVDVYHRIQAAGKGFQVMADNAEDGLRVLEAVGPKGTWLCVGQWFESLGEAQAYLREVERLARR
jgi:hypothetical protein